MRIRRLRPAVMLSVVATLAFGCKDTAAHEQIKKLKAELEEREDELDSAEKRARTAEKEAESATASLKEGLERSAKKEQELLERLRACPETAPPTTPTGLGGECDAYFKFMEDCIPLLPASVQSSMKDSMDTMKKAMTMGGGLAAGALEKACKPALEAVMKLPQCSSVPRPVVSKPCNCAPSDPLCDCL